MQQFGSSRWPQFAVAVISLLLGSGTVWGEEARQRAERSAVAPDAAANSSGSISKLQSELDEESITRQWRSPSGTSSDDTAEVIRSTHDSSTSPEHAPNGSTMVPLQAADVVVPAISVQPAQFKGIQPANTRRSELEMKWGSPTEARKSRNGIQLHYEIEPFESVVVTLKEGIVDTIVVSLVEAIAAERLVSELKLTDILPVTIFDETGAEMGEAFPERGVVFSYLPKSTDHSTQQILLAPIDVQSFLLRAEANLSCRCAKALCDLDYVIKNSPENAKGYWLRAGLLTDLGRYPKALRDAEECVRLNGENPLFRVALSTALMKVCQPQPALEQAQDAVELASEGSIEKAIALACQAEAILYVTNQDYRRSAELHQQAISIAEPLADGNDRSIRQSALHLLLKSNLALARDIAWGSWRGKISATTQWLNRAQAIARQITECSAERGGEDFMVAREALAACVGLQGKLDPKSWTDAALHAGRELITRAKDPLVRSRWEWELGLAMYDALQVYHIRRSYEPALECGNLAVSYLEKADEERVRQPGHEYMMGRLYFRIGSIHAIHFKDHGRAFPWFEKAVPMLEAPIPDSALADIGRQGETFVSIAVSYWETSRREEAVRLTKEGLRLIDQAVQEGILENSALLIPYSNLARMHQQLGDLDEARRYSELAARVGGTKKR